MARAPWWIPTSIWDALIWSSAVENKVRVIYTEDFQGGRVIEGVRFVNPFTDVRPVQA